MLWTNATYDTKRAAWWESMGIMVAYMAEDGPGKNPFRRRVELPRPAHPRAPAGERQPRRPAHRPARPAHSCRTARSPTGPVDILDFKYTLGDLSLSGQSGLPPVVQQGQDADVPQRRRRPQAIYHSLTSCEAPCNRSTGIAYPLADGKVQFESGTLGSAVPPATGALEWTDAGRGSTPGTYAYFCRIHPFMRGRFPGQVAAPRLRFGAWRRVEAAAPAAEQVQAIVEAAEQSADQIRAQAERDVTEARAAVERRGGARRRAGAAPRRAARGRARRASRRCGRSSRSCAVARRRSPPRPRSAAPLSAEVDEELIAEAEQSWRRRSRRSRPAGGGRARRARPHPEGARVLALNMALDGAPREDTARYLRENFDARRPGRACSTRSTRKLARWPLPPPARRSPPGCRRGRARRPRPGPRLRLRAMDGLGALGDRALERGRDVVADEADLEGRVGAAVPAAGGPVTCGRFAAARSCEAKARVVDPVSSSA